MTEFGITSMNRSPFLWTGDPDLPGQIRGAATAGFTWFGPDVFSLEAWLGEGRALEEIAGLMAEQDLGCFELPGFMVGADAGATLEHAGAAAEIAAVLRPRWIPVAIEGPVSDGVVDSYRRCADLFDPLGARLAMEFLPYKDVRSIGLATELVEAVGPERTGMILDTWHFFRGPDGWDELEEVPVELIAYVQFDDALPLESDDLPSETIHRRALPGEGEFDLGGFADRLTAKGFRGVVSVEILSEALRPLPPAEYATRVLESSRTYWPAER
jgi:sugar phosphate isomerase/epimerase